jgi:hypothetical protein
MRAILGNDLAIKAVREGMLPYPDGASLPGSLGVTFRLKENNAVFGRSQSFVAGPPN